MFNFELNITYSEKIWKGEGREEEEKERSEVEKKNQGSSMSPSCSRRFLLHFLPGYKMVISHTPPKGIEVFPQTMILLASILLFFPLLPNSSSSFSRLLKYQHLQKVFPDWLILGCVTMLPRYNRHLCHITHATLLPSICVSDFQTR